LLIISVITAQGVHIASMYIPGLSDVLEIHPVDGSTWLLLLGIAVTLLFFDEIAKWVRRWLVKSQQSNEGFFDDKATRPV
jgi:Ca2+-transporting ATPase